MIIGGAAFAGGRGNVGNALVGAFTIGVIRNALNLHNVNAFYQLMVIGVVMLVAVEADVLRGLRRGPRPGSRVPMRHAMTRRRCCAVAGATKRFGAVVGARRRRPRGLCRRGAGAARRQRRRQVDADQVPQRRAPARPAATIEIDGEPVAIHSPADARALGIETVYQDLALFDNLRPSDNFYAGREEAGRAGCPASLRVLRRREMADDDPEHARPAPGDAR